MPLQRPTIYLFDIDGTLVSTGGVGRRALEAAFSNRYGEKGLFDFSFDGMTDRAIVALALRSLSLAGARRLDPDDADALGAEIDHLLDLYVSALTLETQAAAATFIVHEGARAALDALEGARVGSGAALGLGTGNIRRGAEIKLGAVGLYSRFAFGGFGCDHQDRAEILSVGAARGAGLLGRDVRDCRVLVIGDTPKDVAAARAIGATCLGVATGRFSEAELRESGAHHTAASLASPEAIRVLLAP